MSVVDEVVPRPPLARWADLLRGGVILGLSAILLWAPFPLGSAVSWGAPFLELAIGGLWCIWLIGVALQPDLFIRAWRLSWQPALLYAAVLIWAIAQALPLLPQTWSHPVWQMASQTLGRAIPGTISIDPWRTEDAVLKLLAYAMMFWLTLSMSARARDAERLLGAVIASSAGYGLYGFVLTAIGTTQAAILYTVSVPASYVSGPFMLHNSFATFEGIGFLACVVKGLDLARESVVISRGPTRFLETALQFVIGRGAFVLIAGLLTFSAVVASASRAGSVATGVAFLAILLMSYRLAARGQRSSWLPVLSLVGLFTVLIAILLSGQTLGDRLAELAGGGETDSIRLALWDASVRMISDFPWVGLGLGSFPDAYPLYARSVIPYVTDKAHSDYLELAAGLGLPAAIAFWLSVAWMCVLCIRGFLRRRRDHHFALLGFGATVLVAVHATVDFSLQLPAVGLTYALVLGLGVGQSARSAENGSDGRRS